MGSLGWLGARRLSSHATPDLAAGTERLPPGAAYFAVRLAERQIGLASITIDTLADGIRITERLDLTIPAARGAERVLATADAELTHDLRLRRFTTTWAGSAERLRADGYVEGDTLLVIETTDSAGAAPERVRIPFRGVLTTSAGAPLRVTFGRGLSVGATIRVNEFDPLRLSLRPLQLSVVAESLFIVPDSAAIDAETGDWTPALLDTFPAWHLVGDGAWTDRWVDGSGYPVAARTIEGLALERSAFEIVNSVYRGAELADSAAPGIAPRGQLRRAGPRAARAAVRLVADSGLLEIGNPAVGGATRRWEGDTLAPGYAEAATAPPEMTARMAGPFVPAADPRVSAQARRVTARLSGAPAATALMDWMTETMVLDPDGPSGPVAALEARRGTAPALAALYTAMARSAGIPARLVGGVVGAADGRWYRHTWVEVFAGRWVAADPAFGRYPADGSYVRLTVGGPGNVLAVYPLAGRLTPLRQNR